MAKPKRTTAEKIEEYTVHDPETGCRLWCGQIGDKGYGIVRADGEYRSVHRVAWELERGPIPAGMMIDHTQNVLENSVGVAAMNAQKLRCPKCGGDFTVRRDGRRECKPCARARQRQQRTANPSFLSKRRDAYRSQRVIEGKAMRPLRWKLGTVIEREARDASV